MLPSANQLLMVLNRLIRRPMLRVMLMPVAVDGMNVMNAHLVIVLVMDFDRRAVFRRNRVSIFLGHRAGFSAAHRLWSCGHRGLLLRRSTAAYRVIECHFRTPSVDSPASPPALWIDLPQDYTWPRL